jgi:hypothetical protein
LNGFETTAKEYYMKYLNISFETDYVLNSGVFICSPLYHGEFFRKHIEKYLHNITDKTPFHYEQASFGYEIMKENKHMILDERWDIIWPVCRDVAVYIDKEYKDINDYHQVVYETAYMIHYCSGQDHDLAKDAGK